MLTKTYFRRKLAQACGLGLVLCAAAACAPQQNVLTKEEIADGWQLLFDGKTLDQWKDYNGEELTMPWHVVDGCIQAKGDGSDLAGYIVTKKQYENFILDWDWKLSHGGNSGMIYHVVEDPYFKVPYVTGPEYQLIDNEGWEEVNAPNKLEEWQKLGVDYAMHLPDPDSLFVNPQGEWNSSRIVFDNGHVEHWLNGHKILEFEAWTDDWFARKHSGKWETAPEYGLARRGVICLQDHGSPASFRNLKIKELPRKAGREVELFNGKDLTGWEAYGTEKWYVDKDGNMVCESGPDKEYGYLATREYYNDFDLTLEFKQLANGNSGVFFRSFVEPPVKVHGWQCEVAPKGFDTAGIYESYGRGWLVQIPDEKEDILREGEWNTLRLKVQGDRVQTWLNGEEMVDITDARIGAAQGRIALQIHDGGGLTDMGQHYMDPVQYLLGKDETSPVKVEVDAPEQHPDAVGIWRKIVYTYDDGCQIVLEGEGFESGGDTPYIEGPLGKVYKGFRCTIPDIMEKLAEMPDPAPQNTDFLECVRTRSKFALDEQKGHRSSTLVNLGACALRLNRTLHFDPDKQLFIGDDAANRLIDQPMRGPWHI